MGSNCFCLWKYFSCFRSNGATCEWKNKSFHKIDVLQDIDSVPSNVQSASREALLYVLEDNEAVIKMIIKGISPTMRHVSRTHSVALDWLFDRINLDPKIHVKGIYPAPDIHEHFVIHNGYGKLRTSSRTTSTTLSTLRPIA